MATPQYDRENTRRINLKLNNKTDADIIRQLETLKETEGIQGYLKRLIREDMQKRGEKTMKIFGRDATNLTLTAAARAVYNNSDPLTITEIETDDGFLYNITGIIERNGLTADQVNEALESLCEITYTVKPEYLDQWGEDVTEDTIITQDELERLAAEWDKPVEELLEQLIEQ